MNKNAFKGQKMQSQVDGLPLHLRGSRLAKFRLILGLFRGGGDETDGEEKVRDLFPWWPLFDASSGVVAEFCGVGVTPLVGQLGLLMMINLSRSFFWRFPVFWPVDGSSIFRPSSWMTDETTWCSWSELRFVGDDGNRCIWSVFWLISGRVEDLVRFRQGKGIM